jgi:hypothetical protein
MLAAKPVMEPLPAECFESIDLASPATIQTWKDTAIKAIAGGKVIL